MPYPYFLLTVNGVTLHARLRDGPVHIPFNELNLMVAKQFGHKMDNVLLNLRLGNVKQQLITKLRTSPGLKMIYPVWMFSIKITIRIDRLGLYPYAKLHPKSLNPVNQLHKSVRELILIHVPVAQPSSVGMPLSKPAVIHNEQLNAHLGCPLGKRHLVLCVNIEVGSFP